MTYALTDLNQRNRLQDYKFTKRFLLNKLMFVLFNKNKHFPF